MSVVTFDDSVVAAAQAVLQRAQDDFERPADALFAHVLATVILAHGLGLPLDVLQDGVAAAFRDLDSQFPGGVQ